MSRKKQVLKLLLIAAFALNLHAQEETIKESSYNFTKINIGKGKPNFLELGSDSCHGCVVMGKTLYKVSKENPNYNIDYINISKDRSLAQSLQISMIPTQIIYDKDGKEVFRHMGVISETELLELFKTHKF